MKNPLLAWMHAYPGRERWFEDLESTCVSLYREARGRIRLRQRLYWLTRGHLVRAIKIRRVLRRDAQQRCLQVGGGRHTIPGWLNGDIIAGDIYLNATKRFPLPDNCLDYIFAEQFLEHISYEAGLHFLREAYRVLKPGGVIRQATPALGGLIDVYLDQNKAVSQRVAIQRHVSHLGYAGGFNACRFLNDFFRLWGHQFIYDRETLADVHRQAGFINIQWPSFGESDHQPLQNRERHADVEWMKTAFVVICEATKPGIG